MNYSQIFGIVIPCVLPACVHVLCQLLYKKCTEIRSPTFYYSDINNVFYKPLLEEDIEDVEEENTNDNTKINIHMKNGNENYNEDNKKKYDSSENNEVPEMIVGIDKYINDEINENILKSNLDLDIENQNTTFNEYKKYKKKTLTDI